MNALLPEITVCICTYRRPDLLRRLLFDLARQDTDGEFTFSIVVTDNDPEESARATVADFARQSSLPVTYLTEPRRSISLARNKSLEPAKGEFIAFIDDDEFPVQRWLLWLLHAHRKHRTAAVLGPVLPHFDERAPTWVRRGGFYDRPEHCSGFLLPWQECRTGNVLILRSALSALSPVFRPEFGTGGSDVDLFKRLTALGHGFVWCNEAVAYETLPPNRWKRTNLLRRALLRGKNAARHPEQRRIAGLAKSTAAVLLYAIALPFLQIRGHHLFMRYLVKLCDHAGKLLAVIGLNPIRERTM